MISDIQLRSHFFDTLDWLCQVMVRYPNDFNLALVRIAYGDDNRLGEAYGAPEALRQLSVLSLDLQQAFRKSDLIGRNGTDFWVLFPYTRFGENLYEKLVEVLQSANHKQLNIVDREIAVFELPEIFKHDHFNPDSGQSLIEFLKQHQQTLASHIFRLANITSPIIL